MSGVHKIQSNGKTWWSLTALDYHFATQCLPTPLAHTFANLPPAARRAAVAVTFFLQTYGAVFIISPLAMHGITAFTFHGLLQLLIMATGNYNFFNILTILMLYLCADWNETFNYDCNVPWHHCESTVAIFDEDFDWELRLLESECLQRERNAMAAEKKANGAGFKKKSTMAASIREERRKIEKLRMENEERRRQEADAVVGQRYSSTR